MKEENEDHLSEGNYPVLYTPNPVGISSDVDVDPLATDDLVSVLLLLVFLSIFFKSLVFLEISTPIEFYVKLFGN